MAAASCPRLARPHPFVGAKGVPKNLPFDRLTACLSSLRLRASPRGEAILVYEPPEVIDFGSIADHTFDNPGKGDKGVCGNDPMFGEPSCDDDFGS